jgi:hypothetical protein
VKIGGPKLQLNFSFFNGQIKFQLIDAHVSVIIFISWSNSELLDIFFLKFSSLIELLIVKYILVADICIEGDGEWGKRYGDGGDVSLCGRKSCIWSVVSFWSIFFRMLCQVDGGGCLIQIHVTQSAELIIC